MGKSRTELSEDIKKTVIDLKLAGHKTVSIVKLLNVPESTIRSIFNKYLTSGNVENLPRSGRPKKLSPCDGAWLTRHVKKNRNKVLRNITHEFNESRNIQEQVGTKTVQRFLHANNMKRRVVRKKMVITEVNRKRRLSWCLSKRKLTVNNFWNTVIFSDESQVVIGENHRIYVWRTPSEAYLPECMCPQRQRRVAVMVWGCITYSGVGTLCMVEGNINAQKYIDIIDEHLWPVIAQHYPNKPYRFQDDNAPVHRARITCQYKQQQNIPSITWPAQSPDINIIENLWLRIKQKLQNNAINIRTPQELFAAILDVWVSFTPEYVQNLYKSIPRRLLTVIKSKGHLTKY